MPNELKNGNFQLCGIVMDEETIKYVFHSNAISARENKKTNQSSENKPRKTSSENQDGWRFPLHLGNEVYISTEDIPKNLTESDPFVVIKPGDFVLLLTKETLTMPNNVMGFISMKFDYKAKGLINVSGFHVDPNYEGKLVFAAYHAGPKDIVLRRDEEVFMIFFEYLPRPSLKEHKGFTHIEPKLVESIRGRSATLADNAARLDKQGFYLKVLGGILVTLIVTIINYLITHPYVAPR